MGKEKPQGSSFGQFINQIKVPILGLFSFVSAVVGFVSLAQGKTGLVTAILIILGLVLLWLACLYFVRFWRTEGKDGRKDEYTDSAKLILLTSPTPNNKTVKQQQLKRKERRKLLRRLALIGLILLPLLSIGSYGTWVHVQNLPDDDVVILVADFDGPNMQNNRVTETIISQLRNATDDYDRVKIVALGQAVTEQAGSKEARKIAKKRRQTS